MFAINGFCSFERDVSSLYWQRLCNIMNCRCVKESKESVFCSDERCVFSSSYKYGFSKDKNLFCVFAGRMVNFNVLKKQIDGMCGAPSQTFADMFLNLYKIKGSGGACLVFGEYSAAIYDAENQKLIIFADKSGCFPLYYTYKNKKFVFSSSLDAMMRFPGVYPVVDETVLADMFIRPERMNPFKTPFVDINRVPAGCFVEFTSVGVTLKRYFALNPCERFNTEYLARDAVKLRGGIAFNSEGTFSDFELLTGAFDNIDYTMIPQYIPVCSLICGLKKQKDRKISFCYLPPEVEGENFSFLLKKERFRTVDLRNTQQESLYEKSMNVYFDDPLKIDYIIKRRTKIHTQYTPWWESLIRFSHMTGKDVILPMCDSRFLECVADGGGDDYIYKGNLSLPSADFTRKLLLNEMGRKNNHLFNFLDEIILKSFVKETKNSLALLYILGINYWCVRFNIKTDLL